MKAHAKTATPHHPRPARPEAQPRMTPSTHPLTGDERMLVLNHCTLLLRDCAVNAKKGSGRVRFLAEQVVTAILGRIDSDNAKPWTRLHDRVVANLCYGLKKHLEPLYPGLFPIFRKGKGKNDYSYLQRLPLNGHTEPSPEAFDCLRGPSNGRVIGFSLTVDNDQVTLAYLIKRKELTSGQRKTRMQQLTAAVGKTLSEAGARQYTELVKAFAEAHPNGRSRKALGKAPSRRALPAH